MQAKTIVINDYPIAYLEANSAGVKTLFFLHGNSGSARTWNKQLADPLLKDYRLIAFDLPAHGDSIAAAHPDADYSLPGMGRSIADAVTRLCGDGEFILVGFSLGTNVLAETLSWVSPRGVVLVGSSVAGGEYTMDKIFRPGVDSTVFFSDTATRDSVRRFAETISFQPGEAEMQLIIGDYDRVRPGFRPTLIKTVMTGIFSDEIALLTQTGLPVLVVSGREDKMAVPDYLADAPFSLWRNTVFQLPEAGHAVHIDQPSVFNMLLLEYVQAQ